MDLAAVTFDLWNTLVVERPPGLFEPRIERWVELLADQHPPVGRAELDRAHRAALEAYQAAWIEGRSFCSPEATAHILDTLRLDVGPDLRDRLVASFHEAGLESRIDATPGAAEVLAALSDHGIRTAVICDIGLTPSTALIGHLDRLGLGEHLRVLTWSDVIGAYKPDPLPFEATLRELGVTPDSAAHVGDRRRTDVAGARAIGMTTIRYRGVYDDADDLADADIVVDDILDVLDLVLG